MGQPASGIVSVKDIIVIHSGRINSNFQVISCHVYKHQELHLFGLHDLSNARLYMTFKDLNDLQKHVDAFGTTEIPVI